MRDAAVPRDSSSLAAGASVAHPSRHGVLRAIVPARRRGVLNGVHDAPANFAHGVRVEMAQRVQREHGHRVAARTPRLASTA
jgi:hypothetical protein